MILKTEYPSLNDISFIQGEYLSLKWAACDFSFFLLVLYDDTFVLVPALTEKQAFSLASELQADGAVPVQIVQRLHMFA